MAHQSPNFCLKDAIDLFRYCKRLGDAIAQCPDDKQARVDPGQSGDMADMAGNMRSRWAIF